VFGVGIEIPSWLNLSAEQGFMNVPTIVNIREFFCTLNTRNAWSCLKFSWSSWNYARHIINILIWFLPINICLNAHFGAKRAGKHHSSRERLDSETVGPGQRIQPREATSIHAIFDGLAGAAVPSEGLILDLNGLIWTQVQEIIHQLDLAVRVLLEITHHDLRGATKRASLLLRGAFGPFGPFALISMRPLGFACGIPG
jgi:hypothetical protein